VTGSMPLVAGGQRKGDIEIDVPRFIPANLLTKKIGAFLGVSRDRAPNDLLYNGFQRVEFTTNEGATWIILHKAINVDSSVQFNPVSGNIAAVILAGSDSRRPKLAVFDTARDRINATRIPSPTSLDDPDSPISKVAQLAPWVLKIAGRVAHVPGVGGMMAAALPRVIVQTRRIRGTAADASIRIADLEIKLPENAACFARIGRDDRKFDPPQRGEESQEEREQYVNDMLNAVESDVAAAWREFAATPDITKLSLAGRIVTQRLVEVTWASLRRRSFTEWSNGMPWPLALKLLGHDDGPAQFVHRVSEGNQP
jgi:hypothetical protein